MAPASELARLHDAPTDARIAEGPFSDRSPRRQPPLSTRALAVEYSDFCELVGALAESSKPRGPLGQALNGLRLVDSSIMATLSPMQLQRASRIAYRMQQRGYTSASVNLLLRILYVSASREELQSCFHLLDQSRTGTLLKDEFKELLFIAGESVSTANIHKWFDAIDQDVAATAIKSRACAEAQAAVSCRMRGQLPSG